MLVDQDGSPIQSEEKKLDVKLNYFDIDVITKNLSGKLVSEIIARIQLGRGAPQELIEEKGLQFWNSNPTGDLRHIWVARQTIAEFLITADNIYKLIEEVEDLEEETENASEEMPERGEAGI
jgi:hypothetical protein